MTLRQIRTYLEGINNKQLETIAETYCEGAIEETHGKEDLIDLMADEIFLKIYNWKFLEKRIKEFSNE